MNSRVLHKQFDITIRANLDGSPKKFDIVWQIRSVKGPVFSRFSCKEFHSEKAAYEFGLKEARAWVDEHTCRPDDEMEFIRN